MAEKNFSKMTSKKLNALLETASEEDKAEIMAVLNARNQVCAGQMADSESSPAEEQEAEGLAEEQEAEAKPRKSVKMSDADRIALAESCKVKVNHRCQVVPFNTIDWVNGVITSVMEDKRVNKVLYVIKTDDGRRIVKAYDSKFLKISEETVEPGQVIRRGRSKEERVAWDGEAIANEVAAVAPNIGKTVTFTKLNGSEAVSITGRVTGIVPDKRVQRLLYRIEVPTEAGGKIVMHKVTVAQDLQFAEELDEEGAKINAAFLARRERAANRVTLTPADRIALCKENLAKAEAALEKAQASLEAKKVELEKAQAEFEAGNEEPLD